jgi:hypothetical protein
VQGKLLFERDVFQVGATSRAERGEVFDTSMEDSSWQRFLLSDISSNITTGMILNLEKVLSLRLSSPNVEWYRRCLFEYCSDTQSTSKLRFY